MLQFASFPNFCAIVSFLPVLRTGSKNNFYPDLISLFYFLKTISFCVHLTSADGETPLLMKVECVETRIWSSYWKMQSQLSYLNPCIALKKSQVVAKIYD
jgi:hypothetical protein